MNKTLSILLILMAINVGIAQEREIVVSRQKSEAKLQITNQRSFKFYFNNDRLIWKKRQYQNGDEFSELWMKGGYSVGQIGEPKLPAYKKIFRIPLGSKVSARVTKYSEQELSLITKGVDRQISPVQPSLRKDLEERDQGFEYRKDIYEKNAYQGHPIASVEFLGNLRSQSIVRLTVAPVDYNPVRGMVKVYNDIEIEITIDGGELEPQKSIELATYSPYFEPIYQSIDKTVSTIYDEHPDLTKYPVKMLIISNRMFEQALQPYINWKILKGFKVVIAYTDIIGSTADKIKSYVQQQYNSATPDDPAPTFLVIAGDVEQVAASATGSSTGRKTDLYYASVDGDMFPDMYYGRLSATNTTQLSNIINKILYYEKYQFEDPSYLNKVTLIAGVDASWNYKVGQPTIKYSTANYFNSTKGFTTINEFGVSSDPYNPTATSGYTGCYSNEKISVGMVNYTAHCSEVGWTDPSLSVSAVGNLTNYARYPLSIGNCCLSGDFGYSECVGETWIRGQNKGAVTYIGSSPSTYWLEDFYWAVGAFPMVGENDGYVPTFDETTMGMYDAPFISKYTTTGAMVFAGNLAVTEVDIKGYPNQSSPLYYWQAYNILGDPSLMPYFTEAETNSVVYNDFIPLGESIFKVSSLPGSYIALLKDDQVIGSAFSIQGGEIDVPINPIATTGEVIVSITRPQTIPHFDTINAITPSGPYVILSSYTIDDINFNNNKKADFNETFTTSILIKNLGTEAATNLKVAISGINDYISYIGEDTISLPDIQNGTGNNLAEIQNAFTFTVRENIPDQFVGVFYLKFFNNQDSWISKLKITLNSPEISLDNLTIDDSKLGNNDGILNLGESSSATLRVNNIGHSSIEGLACEISVPDSLKDFISVSYEPINTFTIDPGSYHLVSFRVTSSPQFSGYSELPIDFKLISSSPSKISQVLQQSISIVPNNLISMSNSTITTCYSSFFDSGGEAGNYGNSQNLTTTFYSSNDFSKLKVSFNQFLTENNYDYLYIYNGSNTSAPQVEGSPFSGNRIPEEFISSGNAVTFRFTSDDNTVSTGWAATIECYNSQAIPACASNPNPANLALNVSEPKLSWDAIADAQYYDVFLGVDPNNLAPIGRHYSNSVQLDLRKSTTYYWKIIPGNYLGDNTSSCDIWQFTTDTITNRINISNGTVIVDTSYFYDSGGPTLSYKNKEDYTLTVKPRQTNNSISVSFNEFSLESQSSCSYDRLTIYNGATTSDPVLGYYCGTTAPPNTIASNSEGALTFKFHSDESETRTGWKAIIKSVGNVSYVPVSFIIKDDQGPVANASVLTNEQYKISDNSGLAIISATAGVLNYRIMATGYQPVTGSLTVSTAPQSVNIALKKSHLITFNIFATGSNIGLHGVKVISDEDSSYSNPSGAAVLNKPEGAFDFEFVLDGYNTLQKTFTIPNSDTYYDIYLVPTEYNYSIIVSDINQATLGNTTLYINNQVYNTNPDGRVSLTLPRGLYGLSVSKIGYVPYFDWVNVTSDGEKKLILDPLSTMNKVALKIFGAGPKDTLLLANSAVSIFINDIIYLTQRTNESGTDTLRIPSGLIEYTVNTEGYKPKNEQSIYINDNLLSIIDTLEQYVYSIEFVITSDGLGIKDALVEISGYSPMLSNSAGSAQFSSIGWEKGIGYTVKRDGYNTVQSNLDVISNATVPVNLTLTTIPAIAVASVAVYPNPTNSIITLKSVEQISELQIFDIVGKVRFTEILNGKTEHIIDISSFQNGIYLLKVVTKENAINSIRIIKF